MRRSVQNLDAIALPAGITRLDITVDICYRYFSYGSIMDLLDCTNPIRCSESVWAKKVLNAPVVDIYPQLKTDL
jgi:hypothetical protein